VAGKGTTLFEGAVYGFDVFGIEIEPKSVHEASIFFKKYLETERLKHTASKRQIAGKKKSEAVHIQEFEYARSKEEFKSKETVKKLGMINGNSQEASKYFKKNQFHLIVGDLPYGIVHGNSGERKAASITRNPSELLEACLPAWEQVLQKGGCLVLAWNAFVASKQKLVEIVNQHGLQVLSDSPYDEFQHMVDKSIKRDILVAKKM
jgi:tRNA G10  N-methylase Trm11